MNTLSKLFIQSGISSASSRSIGTINTSASTVNSSSSISSSARKKKNFLPPSGTSPLSGITMIESTFVTSPRKNSSTCCSAISILPEMMVGGSGDSCAVTIVEETPISTATQNNADSVEMTGAGRSAKQVRSLRSAIVPIALLLVLKVDSGSGNDQPFRLELRTLLLKSPVIVIAKAEVVIKSVLHL
jgi:hypothetical protein